VPSPPPRVSLQISEPRAEEQVPEGRLRDARFDHSVARPFLPRAGCRRSTVAPSGKRTVCSASAMVTAEVPRVRACAYATPNTAPFAPCIVRPASGQAPERVTALPSRAPSDESWRQDSPVERFDCGPHQRSNRACLRGAHAATLAARPRATRVSAGVGRSRRRGNGSSIGPLVVRGERPID
jgi:hypothetical protein